MTPQRKPKFIPPISDDAFVQKQLERIEQTTTPPEDAVILAESGLAPVIAKPMEVMPRQESTNTVVLKPDEMKALLADFPDSDFQRGAGGDQNLLYIEHAALRNRLSNVIGLGQWRLKVEKSWSEDFTAGTPPKPAVRVYVEGALIIRGVEFARAVGDGNYYKSNASSNYGDAFEAAQTAALRRVAKHFGIGLQAFSKDFCEEWKKRYPGFKRPTK